MAHGLILPVLALVGWSIVVWIAMVLTRVATMRRERIHPQKAERTRQFATPGKEQWIADNYNHLMEQPTIFYAAALAAQVSGQGDGINIGLAWAYVAIRVAHTLVQTTTNVVMHRFYLFVLSTLVLAVMVGWTWWRLLTVEAS
jgi:hypothetical protein